MASDFGETQKLLEKTQTKERKLKSEIKAFKRKLYSSDKKKSRKGDSYDALKKANNHLTKKNDDLMKELELKLNNNVIKAEKKELKNENDYLRNILNDYEELLVFDDSVGQYRPELNLSVQFSVIESQIDFLQRQQVIE
ncbi:hypothetical protein KUTeg_020907 [Tegillarca granosa]|uniref:Uncharacterized protein n=1 Tax=Tegillarca granosa TaxID=220873 RepID=A0ABQ9EEQ2_TEGGR|nr:hypothetical protein KUTeg_020907 [Tegillarca granosa]